MLLLLPLLSSTNDNMGKMDEDKNGGDKKRFTYLPHTIDASMDRWMDGAEEIKIVFSVPFHWQCAASTWIDRVTESPVRHLAQPSIQLNRINTTMAWYQSKWRMNTTAHRWLAWLFIRFV